ncbi:hypothetical protein AVEN_273829-1 [Araneus ventricosus]|uniref:DUF4371 domain-containing protein n=1 Tax=Araneus ventricosus TaxID=182803 RepID=A0A4Y2L0G6_ARAVE|nr:hypothetical protein AVEN_273829-1 [Araneus ventricosus]
MSVVVRFGDCKKKKATSRYLTSVFLGHTCAEDLMTGFKTALTDLDLKKIIQISMDGPNVNFKFLNNLRKELSNSTSEPVLLHLGSCGSHTLHCAFKATFAETEWNIVVYLRALYNLLKDVPARRQDNMFHTDWGYFQRNCVQ